MDGPVTSVLLGGARVSIPAGPSQCAFLNWQVDVTEVFETTDQESRKSARGATDHQQHTCIVRCWAHHSRSSQTRG
jgi:hypothetical protein